MAFVFLNRYRFVNRLFLLDTQNKVLGFHFSISWVLRRHLFKIFFILFRYLDLYEAIEEGSTDALDNTDLIETDIPLEVPLPEVPHLPRESHEAVKEWVLAVSMDQKVEQRLPVDERMAYEASLITANTGTAYQPCIITGNF